MKELLEFQWPHWPHSFSFDIGGQLRGDDLGGKMFVAEVKGYRSEHDLPSHFSAFLAKCYVALQTKPTRCDHFMWISWAPFQAQRWSDHPSPGNVKKAVLKHSQYIFNTEDKVEAQLQIDEETLVGVADRLWLITLCDKQERLVIADNYYNQVVSLMLADERRAT